MSKKKDPSTPSDANPHPEFDPDAYTDYDPMMGVVGGNLEMSSFWEEPDFLLADIVHILVNLAELEIGITLFVKGMTLTGVLTSERKYLEDLTHTFRNRIQVNNTQGDLSQEEKEELTNMFDFTKLAESTLAQELADEGITMPEGTASVRFLHLKNPLMVGQGGVMDFSHSADIPYIRLRLSLIDGWMLGEIITPDMFADNDGEILH